jgi:iron complex outermembrane recepter protein
MIGFAGRKSRALALRCGVSLVSIVAAAPLCAQSATQDPAVQQNTEVAQETPPVVPQGGQVVTPARSTGDIQTSATAQNQQTDVPTQDIVVTAQRTSQVASKVPISISAYTQETMDRKGVKTIEDVTRFTPGVQFDPGDNSVSIRGISSGAGAGTTGVYIDDTPIQMRALGFSADDTLPAIFDLDRVEILRGPQGTLFGAGSEGGTIRYITPQPSLTSLDVVGRAEVSTTAHGSQSYEAGVAVGAPLINDVLGFRISAWHRKDAGWIDRVDNATIGPDHPRGIVTDKDANSGKVTVLRGALRFEPGPGWLITPSIQYQKRDTRDNDVFFEGISDPKNGIFRKSSPEYRNSKDKFYLPSLNIQYDFGPATLVSNTSYFHRNNITGYDGTIYNLSYYQSLYLDTVGGDLYPFLTPTGINQALPFYLSPAVVTNQQRNFTQEIRLQSSNSEARLNWVVGVFYQRNRQTSIEELVEPTTETLFPFAFGMTLEEYFEYPMYGQDSYINETKAKETQLAGFADVTFSLTEQLKLIAGARYAKAKYQFVNFADGSQNYGRTEGQGKSSETPFTPRLGVSFQMDPRNLFYATYSKGFRVGGANPPVPVDACKASLDAFGLEKAPDAYGADTVQSFEVGAKNRLFGNALQIATSVYNVKWDGIQQSVFLPSCGIQFTDNLGKARSRGFDIQATIRPTRAFSIDAAIGYTKAIYTSDTALAANRIIVSAGDSLGIPPWTVSLGAQYDFNAFGSDMFVRGDYQYISQRTRRVPSENPRNRSFDPADRPGEAINLINLRGGATMGPATVALFVNNLFDKAPIRSRNHSDSDTLLFTETTILPRTIGITLGYRH